MHDKEYDQKGTERVFLINIWWLKGKKKKLAYDQCLLHLSTAVVPRWTPGSIDRLWAFDVNITILFRCARRAGPANSALESLRWKSARYLGWHVVPAPTFFRQVKLDYLLCSLIQNMYLLSFEGAWRICTFAQNTSFLKVEKNLYEYIFSINSFWKTWENFLSYFPNKNLFTEFLFLDFFFC